MTVVMFGEGRRYPAPGALGAYSSLVEPKVGRALYYRRDGTVEEIKSNRIVTVAPGERFANQNPGGGGVGNPRERELDRVLDDVKNGLVSAAAAWQEYGVRVAEEPGAQRGRLPGTPSRSVLSAADGPDSVMVHDRQNIRYQV